MTDALENIFLLGFGAQYPPGASPEDPHLKTNLYWASKSMPAWFLDPKVYASLGYLDLGSQMSMLFWWFMDVQQIVVQKSMHKAWRPSAGSNLEFSKKGRLSVSSLGVLGSRDARDAGG